MPQTVVFIALLLLVIVSCGESAESGSPNGGDFTVVRDGMPQTYDATEVRLQAEGERWALFGWSYRDPDSDTFDDQYADNLVVELDKDALAGIPIQQNHTVSGEASWPRIELDGFHPWSADFVPSGAHLAAIQRVVFFRSCFACGAAAGSQAIEGSLRLSANTPERVAGILELRVQGAVPGIYTSQSSTHDLRLVFDLELAE